MIYPSIHYCSFIYCSIDSSDSTTPSVTSDPQTNHITDTISTKHQPASPSSALQDENSAQILGLDCHLLSRRERTQAELLVETIAQELVSKDKSLAPLLETWAGKTTQDLMEDIFPSHSLSSSQHNGTCCGRVGDR